MRIAILIFDRLTALDAVGPYEVLSRLPGAELRFVAKEAGAKRTDTGALGLEADLALAELPDPDVVLVPGRRGQPAADGRLRGARLAAIGARDVRPGRPPSAPARWSSAPPGSSTASGRPPTGPTWTAFASSAPSRSPSGWSRTARSSPPPACRPGSTWRSALAARIAGDEVAQAIQLGIEYDPQPPFDSGSPAKASAEVIELVRAAGSDRRTVSQPDRLPLSTG